MKVVLLCGGYGMRIRDVAENLPKPLVPIGKMPILWHLMKTYAHYGHRDFVLCLGYQGNAIKQFFLNYGTALNDFTVTLGHQNRVEYHSNHDEADWRVTLVDTGPETMTGGRVWRIRKFVEGTGDFLLNYGDGLGDVNLGALIDYHKTHQKVLTVTGVHPPGRFGEIIGNERGQVVSFNEKPQISSGLISGGFFVCRPEFFNHLNDREDLVLENEPFSSVVKSGQMMVYKHEGFWHPMDTYRDYRYLNQLWDKGNAPWTVWS